jgi:NADPH-dependent F420 reductase
MDTQFTGKKKIAIVGGTGKEGKGLAYRLAKTGFQVCIGSREIEKAMNAASELNAMENYSTKIIGQLNSDVSKQADIVIVTVPYSGHQSTLESIKENVQGKIVVDVSVPLVPPRITRVQMPAAGSAGQEAQLILGENVFVVSAFQNIPYERLITDEVMRCDVLVCGNSKEAKQEILAIAIAIGLTAWDAGPIENSVIPEGMTSILIGINKQFGTTSAGIQITGVNTPEK